MINKKFFGVGGITQVGTPPVSLISSFSATSTFVTDYHDTISGVAYNPSDGYLYTLEMADGNNQFYLIRRSATTGSFNSLIGSIGVDKRGLVFDSNGYFWTILRSANSVVRKYNTSLTYQNAQFNVTGYYADDIALDSNDILYTTRTSSATVYSYNLSGTSQGNFSLGASADENIFHANGRLWRGGNGATWSGRTISTSTNESNFNNNNPYGDNELRYSGYVADDEVLWVGEFVGGSGYGIRKYTANF